MTVYFLLERILQIDSIFVKLFVFEFYTLKEYGKHRFLK